MPPRNRLAMLAAAIAVIGAAASPASATTFVDVSVEELAAASDLIVVGRVVDLTVTQQGPAGQPGLHTRVRLEAEEFLGRQGAPSLEIWVQGGRLGNRARRVEGQATFRRGERVLLFLFNAGGGLWPTGMGRGKWIPEYSTSEGWRPSLARGVVGGGGDVRRRVLQVWP